MTSFRNVIIRNIQRRVFTREYFEETVAYWLLRGWLTESEAVQVFEALDEYMPIAPNLASN